MSALGWEYLRREDLATIMRGIRAGAAFGGPYHVEIHPAGRCNVECFFCSTASIRGDDQMPVRSFLGLLDELQDLGTRSVRLSGGGEPLFHQNINLLLEKISDAGLRIDNLTTNGVLMRARTAEQLLESCDKITISLNAGDAESYGEMMQTSPKNFHRVLDNIRLMRSSRRSRRPLLNLQFLVWRENYRQIPEMYRLARDLGVDTILFNGLAFLREEQRMSEPERREMLALYEKIIEEDEYRTIETISSFEQSIDQEIDALSLRLANKRLGRSRLQRLAHLIGRNDFTLEEKVRHWLLMRERRRVTRLTAGLVDDCVIGWHSLVVKTSGEVSPCCILQHRSLGNVFRDSVRGVWYGSAYQQVRYDLRQILLERERWEPGPDSVAVPMCAGKSGEMCPIKTIYRDDVRFTRELNELVNEISM